MLRTQPELVEARPVFTRLTDGARFIRDMSFPHQVARALAREQGLAVAEFKPRVGKHRNSSRPGLKPQQVELLELAEQYQAFVLTRTKALGVSPWALVFPQEVPNEELMRQVLAELRARQLL
jgi:hypothetical protein